MNKKYIKVMLSKLAPFAPFIFVTFGIFHCTLIEFIRHFLSGVLCF